MAGKAKQYVVEHTAVMFGPTPKRDKDGKPTGEMTAARDLRRGQLVEEADLGDDESRERLVRVGAVRPATRDEAAAGAAQPLHPAVAAALAQRQSELDRLRRLVGDLQERVAAQTTAKAAAAPAGPPDEHPAVKEMLAATDREVSELRERAEALMKQAGELHGETLEQAAPGPKAPPGEELEGLPPPAAEPARGHGHGHKGK